MPKGSQNGQISGVGRWLSFLAILAAVCAGISLLIICVAYFSPIDFKTHINLIILWHVQFACLAVAAIVTGITSAVTRRNPCTTEAAAVFAMVFLVVMALFFLIEHVPVMDGTVP